MGTGAELVALGMMVAMFWVRPFGDAATMVVLRHLYLYIRI